MQKRIPGRIGRNFCRAGNIVFLSLLVSLTVGCDRLLETPVTEVSAEPEPIAEIVEHMQSPAQTPEPALSTPKPVPTPEPTPEPTAEPTPTPEPEPSSEPQPTGVVLPGEIVSPWAEEYIGGDYNKKYAWYFNKNPNHQPPGAQREFDIREYGGYYLGDIDRKEIYLTFDEGYENGYTAQILDVLKEKNVQAAFFLTKPYITGNPELVTRMVDEGHVTANHTVKHPSLPDCTDDEVGQELVGVEDTFRDTTGYELDRFMRPPMGEYSPRVLALAQELGYKTIFWSFAYRDWEVDNQPTPAETYNQVMANLHNGEIILLHAVSSANANALGDIIDGVRELGFEFKSLHDLP